LLGVTAALAGMSMPAATASAPGPAGATVSPVTNISSACAGGNAEVVEATASPDYIYAEWIGCNGIGFARSANGGKTWTKAVSLPGSTANFSWDPAITVAPDGTIYAAYMVQVPVNHTWISYPQIAVSHNHGASFAHVYKDLPPVQGNWGDRVFIAAGRGGKVYLTWDYGPSAALVGIQCFPGGSCAYVTGDLNAVIQTSVNGAKTWSKITSMAPGFPANGGYSAPLLVQPNGRIDAVDWSHHIDKGTYKIHPGYELFLSSRDGTTWPRNPKPLFPNEGTIGIPTWWIDGDISADRGGNLYITWDTQTSAGDIGWLTWSRDGGQHWARPVRVTPDTTKAVHIVQVAGGANGTAYIGWQTNAPKQGYATYLRPFSIRRGWLGPAIQVSTQYGNSAIWPGDTFGLALLPGNGVSLTWGTALSATKPSEIYASEVTFPR
jgi:hypothetical protein